MDNFVVINETVQVITETVYYGFTKFHGSSGQIIFVNLSRSLNRRFVQFDLYITHTAVLY